MIRRPIQRIGADRASVSQKVYRQESDDKTNVQITHRLTIKTASQMLLDRSNETVLLYSYNK